MSARIASILVGCVAACMACAEARATATTHIWAPSTDVQAFGVWHLTSDVYIPTQLDAAGNRLPAVTNLGLTVGILPQKNLNMEIGFDHKSGLGMIDSYPLYGNVKIGVPEGAAGPSPAVAVGLFDAGTKKGRTDFDVIYGEIAKSVNASGKSLGRLSLGYFAGNKNLLLDEDGRTDNSGLLAAWERTFPEASDKLWVCLEYMGTKSVYGSFNFGASWKFSEKVSVLGGYEIFNNDDLVSTFTLQVDIDM